MWSPFVMAQESLALLVLVLFSVLLMLRSVRNLGCGQDIVERVRVGEEFEAVEQQAVGVVLVVDGEGQLEVAWAIPHLGDTVMKFEERRAVGAV